jgi:hypothetical protein
MLPSVNISNTLEKFNLKITPINFNILTSKY